MSTGVRSQKGNDWLRDALPRIVLSPSLVIVLVFVYGFILFTFYLSFTDSRILPSFGLVGWQNYSRLFSIRAWGIAVDNLLIFGSLYIVISCVIGLALAIFLDQKIRAEGFIRTIYLYPMNGEAHPGANAKTDDDIKDYAYRHAKTDYHPVGSCKMGADDDPTAVVNPRLQLKGIEGLRVCDSSTMGLEGGADFLRILT